MDHDPLETCVYPLEGTWNFYARFGHADGYDSWVDGGTTYETERAARLAMERFIAYARASGDELGEAWQDDGSLSGDQRRSMGQMELPLE